MSRQQVLVTFAAPPSFQSSDSCKQVITALRAQLPLRNIHWKSASRPSIRTIQELQVTLVALDSLRDELTSQVPVTLLEKPLLHLYVVTCEDNEAYRTTVKKQIKDWQTAVLSRKNQEWLIVFLMRPDIKTTVDRKFFTMKGSVLDKIKTDFNIDKRDRCVQLAWSAGEQSPAVWADLISKIKDGLLTALECAVSSREEEVKRSEGQRHMPGWNFCTYFILKESLATSYEGVNLFEDALNQYNELEAAFMQVLREKNMSWFGSLIQPIPNDDSLPLLSTSKKPYRDLILANTISVFDLRIYLLSRRAALLSKTHQPSAICRSAMIFLNTFGKRLREVEPSLPDYFIESWTYSSALSVLDQCDAWAPSWSGMQGAPLVHYYARKGELIELAKSQLDILGIRLGYLPSNPPFSLAIPAPVDISDSPIISDRRPEGISKQDIISALRDKEVFYDLYTTTCNRAIDMYVRAGRRKFALKIHGSLATLDTYRGRLSNALTIFASLPAHYAPHRWTSLESLMLSRAIDTHAALEKTRDREWIYIALAFLQTYVSGESTELVMPDEDIQGYVTRLVAGLREATEQLDSDLSHTDHPALSISIGGDARCSDDEDLLSLDVIIQNRLPCDLLIDQVGVTLIGQDSNRLKFTARLATLSPDCNRLTLNCATSCSGVYVLESSEIQISRLRLQWNHKPTADKVPARGTVASLIRLPHDPRGVTVQLYQPSEIVLGTTSQVLLVLSTGRNDIFMATIKLSAPGGVNFDYARSQIQSLEAGKLDPVEDCMKIANAPKQSNVGILIPHTDASRFSAIKIGIKVTYSTTTQPTIARTLRTSKTVNISLPIAVNVEDFFREKRLFSKFTISATTRQHVRVQSAELQGPAQGLDGVKIFGCRPSHGTMIVAPEHPVNYLFSIESQYGPVLESLHLVIMYRMLQEEAIALARRAIDDIVAERPQNLPQGQELAENITKHLENDTTWVELYSATGELMIPPTLAIDEGLKGMFTSLQQRLGPSRLPTESQLPWRQIKIPVDIPRMNITAAARIRIDASPFRSGATELTPIYAGQPISAILSIKTSLHWSAPESKQRNYALQYDVEEQVRDWLVCGRKRGEFIAQDGETLSVPLTMIALHHGELRLPKIDVRSLPLEGDDNPASRVFPSTDTHQIHGAETILVLPRGGRSTFVVGMGPENE